MLTVKEAVFTEPEEAYRKLTYLQIRLWHEQYAVNFIVQDLRPEQILKNEIQAYWEGRIQEIHGWANIIDQIVEAIVDAVRGPLRWLWNTFIRPALTTILTWLKENIPPLYETIVETLKHVRNVGVTLIGVYNVLKKDVLDFLGGIWHTALSTVSYLKETIWGILKGIWNFLQTAFQTIQQLFSKIRFEVGAEQKWTREHLKSVILESTTDLRKAQEKAWKDIVEKVSGAFETLSQQVAALPQAIAAGFQTAVSFIYDILKGIWEEVILPFGQTIVEGLREAVGKFVGFLREAYQNILTAISELSPILPEKSVQTLALLTGVLGATAAGIYGISLIPELSHPLRKIGIIEIAHKIVDWIGPSTLFAFAAGALMGAAVKTPLTYYVNYIVRSKLPDLSDFREMLSRWRLSDEEFKLYMKYYGLDEKWFPIFKELANTPMSVAYLRYYAANFGYHYKQIHEELTRRGYSKTSVEMMHQMLAVEEIRTVRGLLESELMKHYMYGYMSREEFLQELKGLRYTEVQSKLLAQYGELVSQRYDIYDKIKALQYMVRRGKITLQEYAAELKKLGLRDDKIVRMVQIEMARAPENIQATDTEIVKAYGRSVAIKRFKEGITTEKDLEEELRMLGYVDSEIRRLKIYALLERDYDVAMTVLSAVKRAYKKKKIGDEMFISLLRQYGFTDDRILLELQLLKLEMGLFPEETGA